MMKAKRIALTLVLGLALSPAAHASHGLVFRAGPALNFFTLNDFSESVVQTNVVQTLVNGATDLSLGTRPIGFSSEFFAGYSVMRNVDVGLAFSAPWFTSVSDTGTFSGSKLSIELDELAYIFLLRAQVTMLSSGPFSFYGAPSLGYALFCFEQRTLMGGTLSKIEASGGGFSFGAAFGMTYELLSFLRVYGEMGYRFAQSGDVTIDSATGQSTALQGTVLKKYDNTDYTAEASGFMVQLGVEIPLRF